MKGQSLSFPFIYFSESGLFKELRRIQIKNFSCSVFCNTIPYNSPFLCLPTPFAPITWQKENYSTYSDFRKDNVRQIEHAFTWRVSSFRTGGVGARSEAPAFGPKPAAAQAPEAVFVGGIIQAGHKVAAVKLGAFSARRARASIQLKSSPSAARILSANPRFVTRITARPRKFTMN
jgi:hypothetical protein